MCNFLYISVVPVRITISIPTIITISVFFHYYAMNYVVENGPKMFLLFIRKMYRDRPCDKQ